MSNHRRRPSVWSLVLLPVLVGVSSFAQVSTNRPPPSLDAIQQVKELEKKIDQGNDALQALAKLEATIDREARDKYLACMQAFGSEPFCVCLRDETPAVITFAGYVHIVTSTKEELGYDKLDEEDKGVVDKVLAVREHCVANMAATQLVTTNKQSDVKSPSSQGHFVPDKPEK